MLRRLLHWFASKYPASRVIYDRGGVSPYLSRWYLHDHRRGKGIAVFLHKFHRGDDDMECHNHPWRWSIAIILSGGYVEERREGDRVVSRIVRPGTINAIRATDFHRVDLLSDESWSLFIAGPKTGKSWGFWNRFTNEFTPWREFITRKRGPNWVES